MIKTLLLLSFLCYINFCSAQAGKLDATFGNNGIITTDIGTGISYNSMGKQVLIESDSTFYIVSEVSNLSSITKKKLDGTTDLTYGINGNSESIAIYVSKAAIQNDGKIVVVGYIFIPAQQSDPYRLAIARFNKNGSLDTSFNKNGISVTNSGYNEFANSLAIQNDGKIVVGGYTYAVDGFIGPRYILYRFNTDGNIDYNFSRSGVREDFNFMDGYNTIVLQDDGKIIAAGYRWNGANYNFALVRHNTDGTVDSSFPANQSPFNNVGFDRKYKNFLAINSNGKIVVAGTANNNFALARYSMDGLLDTLITTDFNGQNDFLTAATLQKNGNIVLAGYTQKDTSTYFAIASYTEAFNADINFSEDGKLTGDFNGNKNYLNAIAVQNNQQILALGYVIMENKEYTAIAKYNANGSVDNTFANNGKLIENIIQGSTKYTSIAVQNDGKIITGGNTLQNKNTAFVLARYTASGKLDETFAAAGKQINDFGFVNNYINSIAIQNDGKIIAGGSSNNSFALARYNANGTLDNTFGNLGLQKDSIGIVNYIKSIMIQTDGKILAGGSVLARYNTNGTLDKSFNGKGYLSTSFSQIDSFNCAAIALLKNGEILILGNYNDQPMVAKYLQNGQLDSTFGYNGTTFIFGNDHEVGRSLAIQNDGKIVVGGYSEYVYRSTTSYFSIVRLNSNGQPDNTFNGGEILHTPIFYRDYGNSLKIQNDNKIILAGYSFTSGRDVFTIARFTTDGTVDSTFNNNGKVVTAASGANSRIESISIFGSNLYAAGYGQYPGTFGVVAKYLLCTKEDILPMKFISFKAELKNKKVSLIWQVENQKKLSGFVVERSSDAINFISIGYVAGKLNSRSKNDYSIDDKQPLKGINYYRIKVIETNKAYAYSKLVNVNIGDDEFTIKIYPNPAKNRLLITTMGENEKSTIQIINNNGMKVLEILTTLNPSTSIDIYTLPKGIYNLQIKTKTNTRVIKVVKE